MNPTESVRALLTELVRTPSSPDTDMSAILAIASTTIEDIGLEPIPHPAVKALTAMSGRGGLLMSGHLDTVPVASGWTKDQGVWDGDLLYGRGTADMKAGCAASLGAARILAERGVPFSLLLTTDEETEMKGAKALASSDLVREAAAVVVGEPTGLKIVASEKGVLWYRMTTRGRSAHGSMPHLGDNAVYRMGRILAKLEPYARPADPGRELTVSLGSIRGGTAPNVVADACSVDLDCRNPPGTSKEDVERLLRDAVGSAGQEARLDLFHEVPAAGVPSDAVHILALRRISRTEVVSVTYATEMAYFVQHNPRCAVFGPGETERIHVPDERVSLVETVRAAEVLAAFAEALAPRSASA